MKHCGYHYAQKAVLPLSTGDEILKNLNRFILPLILAAGVHAFYTWWFSPSAVFQLAAFAFDVIFISVWLITGMTPSRKRIRNFDVNISGITPQMLEDAVSEGLEKKIKLSELSRRIDEGFVKQTVVRITDVIQEIIDDIQKDPKDLKLAKKFLSYYLDTTIKITSRYIDLSGQKVHSSEMKASLKKAEEMLEKMHFAFRQQLTRLLEDDVMDLNTELELLDRTIKAEGYDNEK